MFNNINERGLSKSNMVLVKNLPGATSEKILEEMDVGPNDLTNNINLLNSAKIKNSSKD